MSDDSGDVYKTLLESTKAIPWSIDWETKQFEYIGPQIEKLLGWSPESWASAQDWIDRIHPDFREEITNYCITQSESGVDHEADYPAATKDGGYVWIRDVVHVVRENGVTTKLIGFMFDISERKQLEVDWLYVRYLGTQAAGR
jgi:PAS domain S-box-containing protein